MSNGNDAEQKAFSHGKEMVYFSDVYFDNTEDNRFEILLTAPASDFNGAFIGVIAFEVDMTPLYKLIQDRTGLGQTGEVLVGRKIGNQVEYLNPLRHEPNTVMKRINIGEQIGGPIQEAVQGKTGAGQLIDYRGKEVISAWRYIPSLDWGMVAKIDTAEAFADVTNLRNLSIIIMVIIFVLAGIVAFSIARSISEPIKRLSEGAQIVGSGNLDYQIRTPLKDEIGQLSRTFDKMTSDLKTTTASRDELNIEIEERKQAEETLRQSEIKYRTVADNTYDWEFWIDPQRQFIYCSPSCERITGHRPEEFLADPGLHISLVHQDDRQQIEKHLREIEHKQTGATEAEWRYVRPDGTFCWVAHICQPVYDNTGRFIGTRGSNRDITARKQVEESLRQAHDQLELRVQERTKELTAEITERKKAQEALRLTSLYARSLIESSLDPLVTISADGKITDVNEATIKVTGVPREKLIGTDFSNYFTEPQKAREGYQQVFAEGFVTDYPLTIKHKDGKLTDVLYNATVYKDTGGNVIGVFAAARDITERKTAEEKQRVINSLLELFARKTARKEYIDSAVNVLKDWCGNEFVGIRIKDSNENIPYESCVGFDKEFLALENPLNLKHDNCICMRTIMQKSFDPEHRFVTHTGSFFCNDSKAFLNGLTEQQRKEYRGNCIKWGFQSIAVIPIRYHQDVIGAIHITDLKKDMVPLPRVQFIEATIAPLIGEAIQRFTAEAELEKHRLHLEELVKQRTDDLTRSNKDLEQFDYVASHDLQEPLRMIAGYTQLIQRRYKDKLDEDANQFIHYTVDGVVRMQSLINDLLAYSRINTSSEDLKYVDCRDVLNEVLAALQMTIEKSGADIKLGPMPSIRADRTQLFQLFQNLIGNAIKFRSDTPPLINITAKPQGKQWLFSVSDNGIGMEPQYLERIFVIFQRLHTQDKYAGTGIGLAICKKIVERHGGRIWAESQPGKGSTFYFII
jgi:PAS domain S-box-containing protein